jgi:hypothetical protein
MQHPPRQQQTADCAKRHCQSERHDKRLARMPPLPPDHDQTGHKRRHLQNHLNRLERPQPHDLDSHSERLAAQIQHLRESK